MNLQKQFDSAMQAANRGNHHEAVISYTAALKVAQFSHNSQLIRSIAFSLAQSLNKLGRYQEALDHVQLGLAEAPTSFGKAIAFAAKGEALCGLHRTSDGKPGLGHTSTK